MNSSLSYMIDRSTDGLVALALSGGVALWLGIMVSAAVAIPVIGFVAVIPAGLVVFTVRQALGGGRIIPDDLELLIA